MSKHLKTGFAILLSVWTLSAGAKDLSIFEIPKDPNDFRPVSQHIVDHYEYRIKEIKCNGKSFGLLYGVESGWGEGTQLVGACAWRNRGTVQACSKDQDPETIECYNKIIDYYHLESIHPKIRAEDLAAPKAKSRPEIPNVDSGTSSAR